MGTRLFPMQGYPFLLEVEVDYALGGDGLTVTTTAANAGVRPSPYGAGQHPYLSPGPGLVDDCSLQLEVAARIVTDEQRQLPGGAEAVEGTAYGSARPGSSGRSGWTSPSPAWPWTPAAGPRPAWADPTAELWVDESYPIIELYTGDTLPPAGAGAWAPSR